MAIMDSLGTNLGLLYHMSGTQPGKGPFNAVKCIVFAWLLSTIPLAKSDRSCIPVLNTRAMLVYPEARRDESVFDVYHGTKVPDPYRWLEDPDSNETKAFIEAQNTITNRFIKNSNKWQLIHDRLTKAVNYTRYSTPIKQGDKYYFFMNTGLQNQHILYVQDSLDGEPRVFSNPNTFSTNETLIMGIVEFSYDGSLCAYSLSIEGSDWQEIHFINTKTGEKLHDVLTDVKFSSIEWTYDNKGIFYSWYPRVSESDHSYTGVNENQKLRYHRVGTNQSDDVIVVEFPDQPSWSVRGRVSDTREYLYIFVSKIDSHGIFVFKLDREGQHPITRKLPLTQIVGFTEDSYDYVANDGKKAIFRTNKNAPNYKLIAIDLENFDEDGWIDLIPNDSRNVLDWAASVGGDNLVISYTRNVKDNLEVYNLKTGEYLKQLPINIGTVQRFFGDKRYSEIFYKVDSFLVPGNIYRADLKKSENPKVYREIQIDGFDASLYNATQIFYSSKDGTKIPMFIVAHKDIVLDGSSPALLSGYGGFEISIKPYFDPIMLVFLRHFRGILAFPNIRGGGEYGDTWHHGGRLLKKQNAFDDFQSAAEYLIRTRYTSAKRLIIEGGSNGGLLVGACINQRPDLFGAAIAKVGVMDMLRFHKFTAGQGWIPEYGSPDDPREFKNLLKYSPLHNVKPPQNGGQYPATLLLTADHDDRVVPMHSLKHIATLQHELGNLSQQTNPLLIRVDPNVGHDGGILTSKRVPDLCRWADDPDIIETKAFIGAQNTITDSFIKALFEGQFIHDRLTKVMKFTRYHSEAQDMGTVLFLRECGPRKSALDLTEVKADAAARELLD